MPDPARDPRVQRVLSQLPERDAEIVAYRFGLHDMQTHTLAETAAQFGVDRSAVRSLESKVVNGLREDGPDPEALA